MTNQEDKDKAALAAPGAEGGNLPSGEGPELDVAGASVASALRTSFLALKLVLLALVVIYLSSGYFALPPGHQAVVVQFGKIRGLDSQAGPVLLPGPHWTWPWPISRPIDVDTEKPRSLSLTSFWFYVDPPLRGLTLDELLRKGPPDTLTPGLDGYLLSGEQEIVHLQLVIRYRLDNLVDFVTHIDAEPPSPLTSESGDQLVSRIADWACTRTVANMRTDTIVRGEVDTFRESVRRLMQERLDEVKSGLGVVDIIVENRTVPLQVRPLYLQVVQAENDKLKVVSAARTRATQVLNEMAGPAHEQFRQAIQAYELARATGQDAAAAEQMKRILAMIDTAGGTVASTIGQAMAERSRYELAVRAEVRRFQDLYDKYLANPSIFIAQLWAEAKADILSSPKLEVIYLPPNSKEIRLMLDHNPQFLKKQEVDKYQQQVGGGG
jgi:regulator of protease activity HflC (stomatin/prohibitin superfamily)